ncbi:hypothetical protein MPLB_430020 [Mesorhizobium sp. ORS 3324]|nr:hypothetical protein MPLB_430020 [Mesorhizobium sp. ORS 3324]
MCALFCVSSRRIALPGLLDRSLISGSDAFVGDKPDARPGAGRNGRASRSVAPEGGVP